MQITISYLLILLIVSDRGSGPHAAQHALRRAALLAAVFGHGPAVARPQGLVRAGPAPGRDLGPQWMSFSMSKMDLIFGGNLANFWRARYRLYQNEILQENMRLTAFFKLYKMCILLHRCNLNFSKKLV